MGLASDIEPAIDGAQPVHAVDHLGDLTTRVVVVGEDQHVGVETGVEVLHLRGRQVVERADDHALGERVGDLGGHRSARRIERHHLATFA